MRVTVYHRFTDFDFLNSLMTIYHSENEKEHLMSKVAVMRIITQLLRIKKENLLAQELS